MGMKGTVAIVVSAGGVSIQGMVTREDDGAVPSQQIALAAAKTGTLSTRTSDTEGTLTLQAEHGINDGDAIDIGWIDDDGVFQACYGATVGTVSGNDVPFTGASGTVLPAQTTSITTQVRTPVDADWDGDNQVLLAFMSDQNGHVAFEDSGDAVLKASTLRAKEPNLYWSNGFMTNPITGNPVDQLQVTNLSTSTTTFKLGGVVNSA